MERTFKMTVGYLPFSADEIDIICSELKLRPVWHYGVEIFGRQRYSSPALERLRARLGVTPNGKSIVDVKIKFRSHNIGSIWIYDNFEKDWFKVPHPKPTYAEGLTLREHKLIQKIALEMHLDSSDYENLTDAKEHLRVAVAELRRDKKLSSRKRAAKITGSSTRNISGSENVTKNISTQQEDINIFEKFIETSEEKSCASSSPFSLILGNDNSDDEYLSEPIKKDISANSKNIGWQHGD
jgi:hypothetical protein